ncbi:portal protein [Thiohalocapsa phage LS06-2018-MD04]|nr:portal protein [Thiohalocapsa phage LS06-2018-MD04]
MVMKSIPETIEVIDPEALHDAARTRLNDNRDFMDDDLTTNWENAYRYYKGEYPPATCGLYGNTSTAVSTDVADAVEWMLPAVLKPLIESPDVVRFDPVNPEDVEQAALESDYVHHTFMKKCEGYLKLYTHIKDALLVKNGIFCTYWDEGFRHQKETYKDLSQIELADLISPDDGSEVRILTQQERQVPLIDVVTGRPLAEVMAEMQAQQPPDPSQPPPPPPDPSQFIEARYDVEIRRYWPNGRPVVEVCEPEAFGIDFSHDSVSLTEAAFCWYTMKKYRADLVALGYDEDKIEDCPTGTWDASDNETKYAREDVERDANTFVDDNPTSDKSQNVYTVHRVFLHFDGDGDGLDERYIVILGGHQGEVMFDYYEVPHNPFSASTPFIAAHKFYGYSLFDKLRRIADHKTKVLRMLEDNLDLSNNPRKKGVRGAFNLDDVLGGVNDGRLWRVESQDALVEVPPIPIQQQAQQLLDYYDKMRSERSGVDPNAQSLGSLPEESMNHAVERLFSAKEELVGMIIRTFAETGIKDMFNKLRATLMQNMDSDEIVQLRNKWATINPANWVERTNTSVVVGLGTGDKMKKAAALQNILQIQMQAMEGGMNGILVSPQRLAHTVRELVRVQGIGDPDDFVLDPNLLMDPRNMQTPRGQEVQMALQMQQQAAQQAQQQAQAEQQAQQQLQERLLNSQQEVAQIKAQADLMKTQLQEQSKAQADMVKMQSEMMQFHEEMRLKWAELAATETANEDRAVVDKAKTLADIGKVYKDSEEREKDRQTKLKPNGGVE